MLWMKCPHATRHERGHAERSSEHASSCMAILFRSVPQHTKLNGRSHMSPKGVAVPVPYNQTVGVPYN